MALKEGRRQKEGRKRALFAEGKAWEKMAPGRGGAPFAPSTKRPLRGKKREDNSCFAYWGREGCRHFKGEEERRVTDSGGQGLNREGGGDLLHPSEDLLKREKEKE